MLKKIGKRLKNQRGLTLIELLAVVVILGIIAAIAVPSIGNIIAKSKYDAAKADAMQVLNAAKLYVAAGGEIPDAGLTNTGDELKEYVDEVNNLDSYTVSLDTNKQLVISATAIDGITEKDGNTAKFDGTVSQVNNYDYKTGAPTTTTPTNP